MVLIQYWHDTNVAKEKPMRKRTVIYPAALSMSDMQKTVGAASMMRKAQP